VLNVEEHSVTHSEAHVPPVRVELRLASVLPLLQQHPHSVVMRPIGSATASLGPAKSGAAGGKRGRRGC
jgi:hypothetical protein